MKSSLILKIIEAHTSGNEDDFRKAIYDLASDEENKGNSALALQIKRTYKSGKAPDIATDSNKNKYAYIQEDILKDKDTNLDLVEYIRSPVRMNSVILPKQTEKRFNQIIKEYKMSDNLIDAGIIPTNKILLYGPPGCGKTMSAVALANELELPIAYVRLDGLISPYLGQTGANLRKVFDAFNGKKVVLFLDEFDAIAKKRDDINDLGELKRVVTTLLQNIDSSTSRLILIAATNHHELLDPAIWRRFDLSVMIDLPDDDQRRRIIMQYMNTGGGGYTINENLLTMITVGTNCAQIIVLIKNLLKRCIIENLDKHIPDSLILKTWIEEQTHFSADNTEVFVYLRKLNRLGITLRTLEDATGIPKSTLSYNFKRIDDEIQ